MTESLFVGLLIAVQISVVIAFFWMVFNIAAIRRMLQNQGLFSGVPCRWCRMPCRRERTCAVTAAEISRRRVRRRLIPVSGFPRQRPRRMRRSPALRALVRETDLSPPHLIAPLFVKEGVADPVPIASMPGQLQHTLESLRKEAVEFASRGVLAFMLFGVPERKDPEGFEAWNPEGIAQKALRTLRAELGDEHVVIADLCLDEYTDHGHCGVLDEDGNVDNDATLERYRRIALAQAEAGAHMVGPSGMMDGQVGEIRDALDLNGFDRVGIIAYAAKFASSFYGPFREAAECAPRFGDRAGYQMDPPNADEAIREIVADIEQGADVVMVKPALPYLDVIRRAKDETRFPMAAYNVSGEFAMVKAASANGWLDERKTVLEILTSIRRAGADLVLTYHAKDAADWLRD
ncbi:MAG: porphobilinogen synthase [Actinomycetota bacterium]